MAKRTGALLKILFSNAPKNTGKIKIPYGGVAVYLHKFIISALDLGE